jgi:phage/conjugal plasmid C-4 type zinc finger TraR family protein
VDDADRAQRTIEQTLADQLAAHRARQPAVGRMPAGRSATHGQYGGATGPRPCLDCGEPIDPRRLAAMPGCIRCVDCQDLADLSQ